MRNLGRFQPPQPNEEPLAICENCGAERLASDLLFDEYAEVFVCDRKCFDEWHDANFETVGNYYFEMNVDY